MKKNILAILVAFLILASLPLAACGATSVQPSSDIPNAEQTTPSDAPVLPADYYIENSSGVAIFKVVTFVNKWGQNCTAMVSLFTDAGPAMQCDDLSR